MDNIYDELKRLYLMTKEELKRDICSKADIQCETFWIFEPKEDTSGIYLVAHIDTVFELNRVVSKKPKQIFIDRKEKVLWSPEGLGADDRTGVYGVMKIREITKCGVFLTDEEESGGIGALRLSNFIKNEKKQREISFLIELDRKGKNEMVFYNNEGKDFIEYIKSFGFKLSYGTFSDVAVIGRQLGIPSVNLSIGYEEQHSKAEYQRVKPLKRTVHKVIQIIDCYRNDKIKFELDKLETFQDIYVHIDESINTLLEGKAISIDDYTLLKKEIGEKLGSKFENEIDKYVVKEGKDIIISPDSIYDFKAFIENYYYRENLEEMPEMFFENGNRSDENDEKWIDIEDIENIG